MRYVVMLRGVNVGGRNKVPMAALVTLLSSEFDNVRTYIQSGNVVLDASMTSAEVCQWVERTLPQTFELDGSVIRALVLDRAEFREVVEQAPHDFGSDDATYRYDVGFFVGIGPDDVRPFVAVNPDVDVVTWGTRAFYHRRITALASRSRVSKIIGTPVYPSLTLRNWRTTSTLARLLDED
ncbi:DUF1697 domain-containing protein [Nocardioides sp. CER19]|uniref:DUF1697 domain-containing protein n=1 Tax=Nocardioides sp. CER19 TaxID=3038538 RepID=UPI0024475EF7|nr:DUF1697 domain-containing protein [Nocardioides sp. CER19]MDH2415205.1 DUF1697 domain-containing protein [Nocardioides sp. CER19]